MQHCGSFDSNHGSDRNVVTIIFHIYQGMKMSWKSYLRCTEPIESNSHQTFWKNLLIRSIPPGFSSDIKWRNQPQYFVPTHRRWCLFLFHSRLSRVEGAACGKGSYRRNYWAEKECNASCLRRTDVHLPARISTHHSFLHGLSIEKYIRHNCLERWHVIYRSPRSHSVHRCKLRCSSTERLEKFILLSTQKTRID